MGDPQQHTPLSAGASFKNLDTPRNISSYRAKRSDWAMISGTASSNVEISKPSASYFALSQSFARGCWCSPPSRRSCAMIRGETVLSSGVAASCRAFSLSISINLLPLDNQRLASPKIGKHREPDGSEEFHSLKNPEPPNCTTNSRP